MINQNELKQFLDYNKDTGILTWIKKSNKKTVLGTRAGSLSQSGYRVLTIQGKTYQEHRVIWVWFYGTEPNGHIDHINHIRDDNRISNLREVSISENARNRTRRDSRVDEVGIWWCRRRKKYIAEITLKGKKVYQKSFDNIDEAISQRKAKSLELGFHINHGNK